LTVLPHELAIEIGKSDILLSEWVAPVFRVDVFVVVLLLLFFEGLLQELFVCLLLDRVVLRTE